MAPQSPGENTPSCSRWPCGVCIQPMAAMIQKVEISVPSATITVQKKCTAGRTLCAPNSITPRKPASRKKAVSTS